MSAKGSLLVINAALVDVESGIVRNGMWMHCRDGLIAEIGAHRDGEPVVEPAEVVDAAGAFVAPGFVSSHSHLFSSAARGLGVDQRLYGWAVATYSVTRDATAEQMYWCTVHGALDALNAGVTTVFDFVDPRRTLVAASESLHGVLGELRPLAHVQRQIDAHRDAGIRAVLAFQIELAGRNEQVAVDEFDSFVAAVARDNSGFLLDAAVFGAAQWADDARLAGLEASAMKRWGILNQAHLFETDELLDEQHDRFEWYAAAGALSDSMIFGHFVHPRPEVVERCVLDDVGVSWQPVANGRLASGVMPVSQLRAGGLRIGIGLDDQACSDLTDPWQSMRFGLYQARAASRSPSLHPVDVLRMQTIDAARLIGVGDRVGSLAPGKAADFILVDPRRPDVGQLWNPLAAYVLSMSTRNIRGVWVGGQLRSDGMDPISELRDAAIQHVHSLHPAFLVRPGGSDISTESAET